MTVFNSNFLMLDGNGGEVEDLGAMKLAGFQGVFCNVRDYPTGWDLIRNRALTVGMFCGPWARIDPQGEQFDTDALNALIAVADNWQQPFIINAEKELDKTGSIYTSIIAQKVGTRDAAISMQPWLFPTVDWRPVAHLPVLLQIFPAEDPVTAADTMGCQKHAWDLGVKCVYFTFGTYRGMQPSQYSMQAPYSLFTGNAIGGDFAKWSPRSAGFIACKEAPPVTETPWYSKPYPKGAAVGPAHLPRILKPPSKNNNVAMTGHDVDAMKRTVSKAQRWLPWAPSQWDSVYNEVFANGKPGGMVGTSGVKGFQRQEGLPQTGIVDDATYQHMRKCLIPTGSSKGQHILDAVAIADINKAIYEFSPNAKLDKIRAAMTDFCLRAETNEAVWHYDQARPFTGLGKEPESTHINDCSGYVILTYFWAKQVTGYSIPDPSGYRYTGYGNTWDDLDGHPTVTSGNFLVGDLAHYDGHVTICRKAGDASSSVWSSMGTESGPNACQLFYRPDFIKVVRPTLLA